MKMRCLRQSPLTDGVNEVKRRNTRMHWLVSHLKKHVTVFLVDRSMASVVVNCVHWNSKKCSVLLWIVNIYLSDIVDDGANWAVKFNNRFEKILNANVWCFFVFFKNCKYSPEVPHMNHINPHYVSQPNMPLPQVWGFIAYNRFKV